jgi:hypothetical protein
MRVANGVYVLPIARSPQEPESVLNLTLIVDEQNGNTLVDAGLPDQMEAISAALVEAGIGVRGSKAHNLYSPGPRPRRFGCSPRTSERCTGAGTSRRCSLRRR